MALCNRFLIILVLMFLLPFSAGAQRFSVGTNAADWLSLGTTYSAGVRWWPWYIYSGWWFGLAGQYQEYNRGGIFSSTTEEGDAYGAALSAGYTVMLHEHLNLEIGAAGWAGRTVYTVYDCPRCGRISDSGRKWFALPSELVLSLVWIF